MELLLNISRQTRYKTNHQNHCVTCGQIGVYINVIHARCQTLHGGICDWQMLLLKQIFRLIIYYIVRQMIFKVHISAKREFTYLSI